MYLFLCYVWGTIILRYLLRHNLQDFCLHYGAPIIEIIIEISSLLHCLSVAYMFGNSYFISDYQAWDEILFSRYYHVMSDFLTLYFLQQLLFHFIISNVITAVCTSICRSSVKTADRVYSRIIQIIFI